MKKIAAFVLAVVLTTDCAPRVVRTTHSLPASVQIGMLRTARTWVAGFVASATDSLDLNVETVRLLRQELRRAAPTVVVDAEPLRLVDDGVFTDARYWRTLGEEHGAPLIVTGVVKLTFAPPIAVQRGRRTVYLANTGRALEATVVLIDGETGRMLNKQPLRQRTHYASGSAASGLALFFDLMGQSREDWLQAIFSRQPHTRP